MVLGALKRLDDWEYSSSSLEPDEMDIVQYDPYLEEMTKPRKKG